MQLECNYQVLKRTGESYQSGFCLKCFSSKIKNLKIFFGLKKCFSFELKVKKSGVDNNKPCFEKHLGSSISGFFISSTEKVFRRVLVSPHC